MRTGRGARAALIPATAIVLAALAKPPAPAAASGPTRACGPTVQHPTPDTLDVPAITGMETLPHAELLPRGQLTLSAGWSEPPGAASEEGGPGSGNQTYFGGLGWGAADRLTLLLGIAMNGDPTYAPIRGERREQYHFDVALGGRLGLGSLGPARVGIQASAEVLQVWNGPGLFNAGDRRARATFATFALDLPLTVRAGDGVRMSLVPSVARLPDRVLGARYFGTVYRIGARADVRVSHRWTLWGTGELPFGPGESTLDRDGELHRLATWRAGVRYLGTGRVGLEVTVTNGSEATPATRHLTQLGAPVTLTTLGFRYAPTVSEAPDPAAREPGSPLEAVGGVGLPAPTTLPARRGRVSAAADTEGSLGLRAAWAFGRRIQFELLTSRIRGADAEALLEAGIADGYQYRFGPQLLVLDQADGAPLSAAGRLTVGRDVDDQQGYLLAELLLERAWGPRSAIVLDPVVVESGGGDLASIGLGGRVGVGPVVLLPEGRVSFTGERPVWTLGVRSPAWGRFAADLHVTTAAGTMGVGRLLADPSGVRLGIALHAAL